MSIYPIPKSDCQAQAVCNQHRLSEISHRRMKGHDMIDPKVDIPRGINGCRITEELKLLWEASQGQQEHFELHLKQLKHKTTERQREYFWAEQTAVKYIPFEDSLDLLPSSIAQIVDKCFDQTKDFKASPYSQPVIRQKRCIPKTQKDQTKPQRIRSVDNSQRETMKIPQKVKPASRYNLASVLPRYAGESLNPYEEVKSFTFDQLSRNTSPQIKQVQAKWKLNRVDIREYSVKRFRGGVINTQASTSLGSLNSTKELTVKEKNAFIEGIRVIKDQPVRRKMEGSNETKHYLNNSTSPSPVSAVTSNESLLNKQLIQYQVVSINKKDVNSNHKSQSPTKANSLEKVHSGQKNSPSIRSVKFRGRQGNQVSTLQQSYRRNGSAIKNGGKVVSTSAPPIAAQRNKGDINLTSSEDDAGIAEQPSGKMVKSVSQVMPALSLVKSMSLLNSINSSPEPKIDSMKKHKDEYNFKLITPIKTHSPKQLHHLQISNEITPQKQISNKTLSDGPQMTPKQNYPISNGISNEMEFVSVSPNSSEKKRPSILRQTESQISYQAKLANEPHASQLPLSPKPKVSLSSMRAQESYRQSQGIYSQEKEDSEIIFNTDGKQVKVPSPKQLLRNTQMDSLLDQVLSCSSDSGNKELKVTQMQNKLKSNERSQQPNQSNESSPQQSSSIQAQKNYSEMIQSDRVKRSFSNDKSQVTNEIKVPVESRSHILHDDIINNINKLNKKQNVSHKSSPRLSLSIVNTNKSGNLSEGRRRGSSLKQSPSQSRKNSNETSKKNSVKDETKATQSYLSLSSKNNSKEKTRKNSSDHEEVKAEQNRDLQCRKDRDHSEKKSRLNRLSQRNVNQQVYVQISGGYSTTEQDIQKQQQKVDEPTDSMSSQKQEKMSSQNASSIKLNIESTPPCIKSTPISSSISHSKFVTPAIWKGNSSSSEEVQIDSEKRKEMVLKRDIRFSKQKSSSKQIERKYQDIEASLDSFNPSESESDCREATPQIYETQNNSYEGNEGYVGQSSCGISSRFVSENILEKQEVRANFPFSKRFSIINYSEQSDIEPQPQEESLEKVSIQEKDGQIREEEDPQADDIELDNKKGEKMSDEHLERLLTEPSEEIVTEELRHHNEIFIEKLHEEDNLQSSEWIYQKEIVEKEIKNRIDDCTQEEYKQDDSSNLRGVKWESEESLSLLKSKFMIRKAATLFQESQVTTSYDQQRDPINVALFHLQRQGERGIQRIVESIMSLNFLLEGSELIGDMFALDNICSTLIDRLSSAISAGGLEKSSQELLISLTKQDAILPDETLPRFIIARLPLNSSGKISQLPNEAQMSMVYTYFFLFQGLLQCLKNISKESNKANNFLIISFIVFSFIEVYSDLPKLKRIDLEEFPVEKISSLIGFPELLTKVYNNNSNKIPMELQSELTEGLAVAIISEEEIVQTFGEINRKMTNLSIKKLERVLLECI